MQADVRPLAPDDPPRIGGYRLLGRLGEGGQGCVYLAVTPDGARRVALKTPRACDDDTAEGRRRLAAEADALARILPHFTAQLVEAHVTGAVPYLATAFIDGPSLFQQVVRQGPLAGAGLERLAAGTLTALIAVHDAGLVHHDVKPGNVLLGRHGPRLIDFGAATPAGTPLTGARSPQGVLATPAFMAPELLGVREVTPASDLFSWASTMTFAATGRGPFHAVGQAHVLRRVEHDRPDLDGTPETLRPVLRACLAKDPAGRPTAAFALDHLLRAIGLDPRPLPPAGADPAGADGTDGTAAEADGTAGAAREDLTDLPVWEYATVPLELPA